MKASVAKSWASLLQIGGLQLLPLSGLVLAFRQAKALPLLALHMLRISSWVNDEPQSNLDIATVALRKTPDLT